MDTSPMETGFIYGFDASQITLTLFGGVMQSAFFDAFDSGGDMKLLYYFATICGLIGMSLIFLMPKKIGAPGILAWCFLMIVIFARPTPDRYGGDSIFFTNLLRDPILENVVPYGGTFSNYENQALLEKAGANAGTGPAKTYKDALQQFRSGFESRPVNVLSMHVYLIHYLNLINFAINDELIPYGKQMASSMQNFIEAIKYARTADPNAPYQTAEFAVACRKSSVMQESAFRTFTDVARVNPGALDSLKETKLDIEGALALYRMFADYQASQGTRANGMLPPLVKELDCSTGGWFGIGGDDGCEPAEQAVQAIMYDPDNPWKGHTTAAEVALKLDALEKRLISLSESEQKGAMGINVTLAVPLGLGPITKNIAGSANFEAALARVNSLWGVFPEYGIPGSGIWAYNQTAEQFNWPVLSITDIGAAITGWLVTEVSSAAGYDPREGVKLNNAELIAMFNSTQNVEVPGRDDALGQERVSFAENCLEMHGIKSVRQMVATIVQTQAGTAAAEALRLHEDTPNNFESIPESERVEIALNQQLAARVASCQNRDAISAVVRDAAGLSPGSGVVGAVAGEVNEINQSHCWRQAQDLMDITTRSMQGNDWARITAVMSNSGDPRYIGGLREGIAEVGSFVAPIAIWFKGLVGGFTSGTYAEIMPSLVSLGIAIALMFAPLIMMLGLLLPMYALNSILLPIMLIAYLGMVRITFSLIHMFAGIMQGGAANNSYELDGKTISMVDIALGNAYGAAFILTGALLVMLKNPGAIVQKFAGSADKMSSVSFQEVMAAGGALALAKKAVGTAAFVASGGAAAAVGKTVGALTSGNMLRNQVTGLKSGMVGGAQQAQQYESGAAEFDSLAGSDEGLSGTLRENAIMDGKGSAYKKKTRIDPRRKAASEKDEYEADMNRAAKEAGIGGTTKGVESVRVLEDGTQVKDIHDPFLEELQSKLANGIVARAPANYQGKGGYNKAKAEAAGKIAEAIDKGLLNRENLGSSKKYRNVDGSVDKKVVNILARTVEQQIMDIKKPRLQPGADGKYPNELPKKDGDS